MSPSESQLRAALHEGEGEVLDAGRLIAQARAIRRERLRRRNQLVAATLVIGVVGAGFTLLVRAGSSDDEGGGSAAEQQRTVATSSGVAGGAVGLAPHKRAAASPQAVPSPGGSPMDYGRPVAACPRVPDQIALPTGVTRDDASGPLIPRGTAAIRACAYPSGTRTRTLLLRRPAASALADTLNSASIAPRRALRSCTKDERVGTVELVPLDGSGRRADPVVVTVACPEAVATNGTATRYFPVAPKLLSDLLR